MENRHTLQELKQWQKLPLNIKVAMTAERIRAWVQYFGEDGVYISFSGGKDSTVLLDIARNVCGFKKLPAVFVDVPTQYPELRTFAEKFDNVEVLKPKTSFVQVCDKYGFPLISKEVSESVEGARKYLTSILAENSTLTDRQTDIRIDIITNGSAELASILNERMTNRRGGQNQRLADLLGWRTRDKVNPIRANIPEKDRSKFSQEKYGFFLNAPFEISNKCCNVMKKEPAHRYSIENKRYGMTAQMADESRLRQQKWLQNGCNGFDMKAPISNPMAFWTENDVLEYIIRHDLEICSVYGDIVEDFGKECDGQMHLADFGIGEKKCQYKCTGCKRTGCMLCGFGCHLEKPGEGRFEKLKVSHPKMYNLLDVVKNNGVTFREAIEWTNQHGNLNIRL